jgi:predicted DsbA family dithiol-disulfide isomerase
VIIEIWSDVVCPWCFIGRRRLQRALKETGLEPEVRVIHRAFELQPDIREVLPTAQHLADKYRIDPTQVLAMQEQVCDIADGEGLCYSLEGTLSGNTFDAHRLLLWAVEFDKQDELLEAMYSAYFEKNQPLFTHADLVNVAMQVGISADETMSLLTSDRFEREVRFDQERAGDLGVHGVPFYVIDERYGISGAQPVEVFTEVLRRARMDSTTDVS